MSLKVRYLLGVMLLLVCSSIVFATPYTPSTVPHPRQWNASAFVSNPDAILTTAEASAIQQVAVQLNQATGVELVTVALRDIGYADAFDFALELFNRWGIGARGRNNGVLIFLALESRDIQIITGGGIEGLLPDAACSRILHDQMIPLLSEGRYAEGLLAGNKAIALRLTDQRAMEELLLGYKRKPVTASPWQELSIFSLIVALLALIYYWCAPRCPKCRKKGIKVRTEMLEQATYKHSGLGIKHYTCPCCGHTWEKKFKTPKAPKPTVYTHGSGSSFGGGGFHGGSFGGGSSFGGGAGGKF